MMTTSDRRMSPESRDVVRRALRLRRAAFTVVEVTVISGLMAFLAMLLAESWRSMGRPTSNLIIWGQIFQEMDIAVASLTRDLGGSLPDVDHHFAGGKNKGRFLAWRTTDGNSLQLAFSGGTGSTGASSSGGDYDWDVSGDDVIITYSVNNHYLVRTDSSSSRTFAVASLLSGMAVTETTVGGEAAMQIVLSFSSTARADMTVNRSCTLIAKKPPT
jgi:hypothetical protein